MPNPAHTLAVTWEDDAAKEIRHRHTRKCALRATQKERGPIPDAHLRLLPMFLAVRGTTYLGWVHTRKSEATAQVLTPQLIELAMAAAGDYLAGD